ncbi:MAG: response regulator [Candidatus Zixiibacteriota bacterium]
MLSNQKRAIRILVIDQESDIRKSAETFLGNDGFWVESASNIESARRILQKETPDIILIDYELNRLGGTFIQNLRIDFPETKIVVLLYDCDKNNVREAIVAGADEFIRKPFNSADLMFIIERLSRGTFQASRSEITTGP